jgi:hypothetical protein
MNSRESTNPNRDQTIARARAIRAEQARAAAFYANRVEQARASARYGDVAHWTDEYRRSAARCRLFGEMIRSEREAA